MFIAPALAFKVIWKTLTFPGRYYVTRTEIQP